MAVAPREDKTALGLTLMAIGVIGFTCIDTSAKWLLQHGIPALQVVWCRYAAHLVLVLVAFFPREGKALFHTEHPWKQTLRAAALFGSTMLNFLALGYLPITVTTTIMFAGPIVVTLLAIPLLGEKVGPHRIGAVCVGFLGVLVVMQPWGAEFHPAMLLSVGALSCAALYFILTRQMAGKESNATSQVWGGALPTLLLAPVVLPSWEAPESAGVGVMMGVIGIFGAVAHMLATAAHRYADASVLAPVVYLQLLSAAAAGLLIFGTWPTPWTLLGAAIIIGAGLYIWHRERQRGVPHHRPPRM
ncbi:DMT family transporter [Salipiger sp. PrR002]|uniref:DMT family transporter n=1 Tax=Salipiger sp. PrR002 TaxID=2706489 RepID=UPI0013BACA98|nr:DMT family transporter [Salipiger sp. PrR002]NDV98718.1 DMT family transporter [Salipiger sp. PrR002]NDW57555.1 DMT family transporter [Salipiger sp. PrR004]